MTKQRMRQSCWLVGAACAIVGLSGQAGAQAGGAGQVLHVDASAPMTPAGAADYQGGSSRAPDGSTIGVTDRYLTLDGKPWLPVMGEMHYSRVPEADWEDEILKMKSAGVNVISTYIIWIHHEEIEGAWDWTGQKDLRHFAELCQKHGMLLYPRIGPWAHGEVRNGGLPDWVMAAGPVRRLDPKFMAETKTLYDQVGEQLRGMLWKDGGPVIGVQIENEYASRGPGKGAEYILALKKMAIASGFDVPLYTVTGWDNAVVPEHEFLPVYGGYPDAPWGASRTVLPPNEVYAFRFRGRVSGNMGMIGAAGGGAAAMTVQTQTAAPAGKTDAAPKVPFLTAEIGGGIEDTYHRRPVISGDDIAAMVPVLLGSGVNLYGSYMFHGGENPDGKLTTLEESQATHYPTDLPVKSYDFQAPIGEYGLERRSLRMLKNWNYLMNDFGSVLAPMPAFAPDRVPRGPADLSMLRWSVRTDGERGFLFVNNYVREAVMPAWPQTQFAVSLPGGRTMRVPEQPVDIPAGAYFAWPFGLDLGGVRLRYATAQLMARVGDAGFVLMCVRGVRCEVALDGQQLDVQAAAGFEVEHKDGATIVTGKIVTGKASGTGAAYPEITVRASTGKQVQLLMLSEDAAENTWKVGSRLLQTSADVFADASANLATLRQLGDPAFHFSLYPPKNSAPQASVPVRLTSQGRFMARVPALAANAIAKQTKPAGTAPPIELGPALSWRPVGVAEAPSDATWSAAAADWSLTIMPGRLSSGADASGVSNLFLRVSYTGDQARLRSGNRLLDDDFFNGEPWVLGLDRYMVQGKLPPLELQILPMRADAPVYLPKTGRATIATSGQTVGLTGLTLTPQYQLRLTGIAGQP